MSVVVTVQVVVVRPVHRDRPGVLRPVTSPALAVVIGGIGIQARRVAGVARAPSAAAAMTMRCRARVAAMLWSALGLRNVEPAARGLPDLQPRRYPRVTARAEHPASAEPGADGAPVTSVAIAG